MLVTITEDTLAQFPYRSPIDRAFLAGVIEGIAAAYTKRHPCGKSLRCIALGNPPTYRTQCNWVD